MNDKVLLDNYFCCSGCSLLCLKTKFYIATSSLCFEHNWKEKDHIQYIVRYLSDKSDSGRFKNQFPLPEETEVLPLNNLITLIPTRESYLRALTALPLYLKTELENGDFYSVKRKIFDDYYHPEMKKARKMQMTEMEYPNFNHPLDNPRTQKILRIKNGTIDGVGQTRSEGVSVYQNPVPVEPVPYNMTFYPSNTISPVFFGRATIKAQHLRQYVNDSGVHPACIGYLIPPLNQPMCQCLSSLGTQKFDGEVHGITSYSCFHSSIKPILTFDGLPVNTDYASYFPEKSSMTTLEKGSYVPSLTVAEKNVLGKEMARLQTHIATVKDEAFKIIPKPVVIDGHTETLDIYELMDIDSSTNYSVFRSYPDIFQQMMLEQEDYLAIRRLNCSELAKLDELTLTTDVQSIYECQRCHIGEMIFSDYMTHITSFCTWNVYPCKLSTSCTHNFISLKLYQSHAKTYHKNLKVSESANLEVQVRPIEIEIPLKDQWIKATIKSFSNRTYLHTLDLDGRTETIRLIDHKYRFTNNSASLKGDIDLYQNYITEQNLLMMNHYLLNHKLEIHDSVSVIINNILYQGELRGFDGYNKLFQVVVNNEVKNIPMTHLFNTTEINHSSKLKSVLYKIQEDQPVPAEIVEVPIVYDESNENDNSPGTTARYEYGLHKGSIDEPHNSESSSEEIVMRYDFSEFDNRKQYLTPKKKFPSKTKKVKHEWMHTRQ